MHRIGRTGRAEQQGKSILFFSPKEMEQKEAIEALMDYKIPQIDFPEQVEVSQTLIPEERPKSKEINSHHKVSKAYTPGPAFHEKKDKNKKENLGGSYRREMAKKYKKPRTKGGKKKK
jgi:ATP-dependent RNA helicase RhlE